MAPLWLTLPHLDVAVVDRIIGDARSGAVSTATSAGEVEAIRFRDFTSIAFSSAVAVVLHSNAEGRLLAVIGAVSLELHGVGSGGHRAALVANAAEEGYLFDADLGVGGVVGELKLTLKAVVMCPLRVVVELDLATSAVDERTVAL